MQIWQSCDELFSYFSSLLVIGPGAFWILSNYSTKDLCSQNILTPLCSFIHSSCVPEIKYCRNAIIGLFLSPYFPLTSPHSFLLHSLPPPQHLPILFIHHPPVTYRIYKISHHHKMAQNIKAIDTKHWLSEVSPPKKLEWKNKSTKLPFEVHAGTMMSALCHSEITNTEIYKIVIMTRIVMKE